MKRVAMLEEISDGKLYDIKDLVKADAGGCEGCSACCHGVGDLVELTPFDIYEMARGSSLSYDEIFEEKIELRENNKLMIPYLKMYGASEACSFLNEEKRCSIHGYRPNICRLFPLGRAYMADDFKYFLQVDACTKTKLGKVKVKKWIGIENYNENKKFILAWYQFLKALSFRVKFIRDEEELKMVKDYLIDVFYRKIIGETDFYKVFFEKLPQAKDKLGIM